MSSPIILRRLLPIAVCVLASSSSAQERIAAREEAIAARAPRVGVSESVAERGLNHRVVRRVETVLDAQGDLVSTTNSYTQLESGLHYLGDDGELKETEAKFESVQGGATAWRGPHRVSLTSDLNTQGAIQLRLPDGQLVVGHVVGLAYYDVSSDQSILFAPVRSSEGWLVRDNEIVYPEAFEGTKADVRYTFARHGFEQDVILREAPPGPAKFGMNPETTRIEVWTEFTQFPEPSIQRGVRQRAGRIAPGEEEDQVLNFGSMRIGEGLAFAMGQQNRDEVVVQKQWVRTVNGRTFLVEAVDIPEVAPILEALPTRGDGAKSDWQKPQKRLQALNGIPKKQKLPKAQASIVPIPKNHKLLAALQKPGLVMDYQFTLTGNFTDFTFKGDTTYYVSGFFYLYGTTTLEGGAVVKYAQTVSGTADPRLYVAGPLVCKTSLYRPAIFTAKDDDSVGEKITGSTSSPTTSPYANFALRLISATDIYKVEHVGFRYCYSGISFNNANSNTVSHAQFVKCWIPLMNSGSGAVAIYNGLVDAVPSGGFVFHDWGTANPFYGQHLTINNSPNLRSTTSGTTLNLVNSILATVGNTGTQTYTGSGNFESSSSSGLFQTVLAGDFYLASQSPHRNAGTTAVEANLAQAIKRLTTFPPQILSANFNGSQILEPQALRDADLPDRGYHYPPLDYVWTRLAITNATLTLTNGTAVGFYGPAGVTLVSGASLVSAGLANQMNRLTTFNAVQEQPERWITNTTSFTLTEGSPKLNLRYTDVSLMSAANSGRRLTSVDSHGESIVVRDAYLRGVYWYFWNESSSGFTSPSHSIINSLVDRSMFEWFQGSYASDTIYYLNLTLRNNLFVNTRLNLKRGSFYFGNWAVHDNVFNGVNPNLNFYTGYSVLNTVGYNGAIAGTTHPFSGTGDKNNLASDFQVAALGDRYYLTSSPNTNSLASLIDRDSSRTPASVGLYHHTTRTDYAKDGSTSSALDIGFHYVSSDANGRPVDQDGDGIPDYLEDYNGNNSQDAGETSVGTSNNGIATTGTASLVVFTPIQ